MYYKTKIVCLLLKYLVNTVYTLGANKEQCLVFNVILMLSSIRCQGIPMGWDFHQVFMGILLFWYQRCWLKVYMAGYDTLYLNRKCCLMCLFLDQNKQKTLTKWLQWAN